MNTENTTTDTTTTDTTTTDAEQVAVVPRDCHLWFVGEIEAGNAAKHFEKLGQMLFAQVEKRGQFTSAPLGHDKGGGTFGIG